MVSSERRRAAVAAFAASLRYAAVAGAVKLTEPAAAGMFLELSGGSVAIAIERASEWSSNGDAVDLLRQIEEEERRWAN